MTYVKKILFETLIFKSAYFDTVIDVSVKKREQNQLEREFTCEDQSHCPYTAEASNLSIGQYSCNPKTISGLFHQEWWITQNSWQEHNSSFPWIEHEIITLLQKLDWKLHGRCTHSYRKEDKHFLYNGECTICFDNNASEAEVITDTKKSRKVNHQIHWRPEQDAKYWIYLSATQKRILADNV